MYKYSTVHKHLIKWSSSLSLWQYTSQQVRDSLCCQSINQSLFVSGNKNPYYLGLKERKIERKYT